jgi:hypothetical protein
MKNIIDKYIIIRVSGRFVHIMQKNSRIAAGNDYEHRAVDVGIEAMRRIVELYRKRALI